MKEIARFGVSMDKELLDKFDKVISKKGYTTRSEAIRDLIRNLIVEEEWSQETGEVMGVVVTVYDHKQRELCSKIVEKQHHHTDNVICTLHIHIDEVHCMEITALKGTVKEVKELADELRSFKGVKYSKFVKATTGSGL